MNELFFELIRVAVGKAESLSRLPNDKEWDALYVMAQKHSLVGVCFAGLQKLGADADEGFARIGISEMLYLTWLGMAAKIQQKNEVVNHQCVALLERLNAEGIGACVLKGQGVGQLYKVEFSGFELIDLSMFRQSGDIDAFVDCGRDKALSFVQSIAPTNEVNHKHVQFHCFGDTEVELHYIAAELHCPWHNKHLQRFFARHGEKVIVNLGEAGEVAVPCEAFIIVHLLAHAYRHMFGDGIGLRQVMDLYFALLNKSDDLDCAALKIVVRKAGLEKFASAMIWVLQHVFGLRMYGMPWLSNERDGQFLLKEIMLAGDFGKYDERIDRNGESHVHRFWRVTKQNWRLMRFSPWEVVCTPMWRIWHFCWMRIHGYTQG